jgi:hypothetical protein
MQDGRYFRINVDGENNGRVVLTIFNGTNRLTRNAHSNGERILTDLSFFAKARDFVFHD